MPSVTTHIIPIPIPLPFPLKFVNCYLIQGPAGWALVDTGINWPPARQAWLDALERYGLHPTAIDAIYVTHYHPDHIGLAGWCQELSGAPVYMTPYEAEVAQATWNDGERSGNTMASLFLDHGIPAELAAAVAKQVHATQAMTQPLPSITTLPHLGIMEGEIYNTSQAPLILAGQPLQPLVLPGHADEQLCLYEPQTRTLLAADHVLPRISPNISILPLTRPNPLARYLASYTSLEALDVATVIPGHGPAFTDLHGRLRELREHHELRLEEMHAVLGEGKSAYEVCTRIFPLPELSPHQIQFALGETIAHLDYLVAQGRAACVGGARIIYHAA